MFLYYNSLDSTNSVSVQTKVKIEYSVFKAANGLKKNNIMAVNLYLIKRHFSTYFCRLHWGETIKAKRICHPLQTGQYNCLFQSNQYNCRGAARVNSPNPNNHSLFLFVIVNKVFIVMNPSLSTPFISHPLVPHPLSPDPSAKHSYPRKHLPSILLQGIYYQ